MLDIKRKITEPAYDFLRKHEDLKDILYLTLSGSHAYGTNKEGSDIDLRGVLVEQPRYLFGLEAFEQFEEKETDTVIYGLKKYIALCVQANPNALELLGTKEECIAILTPAGRLLRENAALFLSRRAVQSFGRYAVAQLRRLSSALCHDHYNPMEQQTYLADTLNGQIAHFNRTYTTMGENGIRIYPSKEGDMELRMDISLQKYPLKDFSGILSEIQSIARTYGKMNHRNRKKSDRQLYKHAMHLIRLLMTGEDILKGHGILTCREKEHTLLMDIRNGVYTFDEIFAMAENFKQRFEAAAETTALPEHPDRQKIEALMQDIYTTSVYGV